MNNIFKILLIVSMSIFLSACGGPTLDADSYESLKESTEVVFNHLAEDDKKQAREFKQSFMAITVHFAREAMKEDLSEEEAEEVLMDAFDGKTGEEVIELAKNL